MPRLLLVKTSSLGDVVHNLPVKNVEALANPEALELFRNRAELLS